MKPGLVVTIIFSGACLVLLVFNSFTLLELLPLRTRPLQLVTSSDLSGGIEIRTPPQQVRTMTLSKDVINKNGAHILVAVRVQDYPNPTAARTAFAEEVAFWQNDESVQPNPGEGQ